MTKAERFYIQELATVNSALFAGRMSDAEGARRVKAAFAPVRAEREKLALIRLGGQI